MDLKNLSDIQLRQELRLGMENYLFLIKNVNLEVTTEGYLDDIKQRSVGIIFDEIKRRREQS